MPAYSDNFPLVQAHLNKWAWEVSTGGIVDIISRLLKEIKQTAVEDFMAHDGGAVKPDKLTIRSKRLANAVLGTSSNAAHVERVFQTGAGQYSGKVGVQNTPDLPYAEIHETGGTIHAKTDYLHFKIGDNWIKVKKVEIPKRSYMHPAKDKVISSPKPILIADKTMNHYISLYGLR